jgi:flagellar basal body L-ring protein FlgH
LCWVLREPKSRCGKRKELNLGVVGLVSRSDESLEWLQRDLQPGDEVTIRIIEAAKVDKPQKRRRQRATATQIQLRKQALIKRLAKELGWKVQTQ